ncbi:MAG TPA: TPM domain-containing protein [Steroidobacteraceae bacterium]|nr:TPM domain-containing protein [Steroidobacteraceae bacterium]
MRRVAIGLLLLGVLALAFVTLVPKRDSALANWWIRDDAHLLKPAEELRLTRYHSELLEAWDIDYRIHTVREIWDLDTHAVETFAALGVGTRSGSGRGLLLVVDPERKRVRLEVARELEGVFPDAFVSRIEHEQMAPFFGAGRVADGILATTELLVARAAEPAGGLERPTRELAATSAGGGAAADAPIDQGYERPVAARQVDVRAGSTPQGTIAAYLAAMAVYDASPDLDLYTPESRAFLNGHVVTRAQMENLVRTYLDCGDGEMLTSNRRAVVRYPQGGAACAPWLLVRGDDSLWRLDLATMSRALRFDTANRWRLADPQAAREYGFGLEDES